MKSRPNQRDGRQARRTRRSISRRDAHSAPVSSHPEIEEEIESVGGGLDESRMKLEKPLPAAKPIVSVDGRDVEEERIRHDRAA